MVAQQKFAKVRFRTHTSALWPMEQSCILFAKFDCPVAHENLSLLATAHDCGSGFLPHAKRAWRQIKSQSAFYFIFYSVLARLKETGY